MFVNFLLNVNCLCVIIVIMKIRIVWLVSSWIVVICYFFFDLLGGMVFK